MTKTAFLAILALQICLDRRGFSPNAMEYVVGGNYMFHGEEITFS